MFDSARRTALTGGVKELHSAPPSYSDSEHLHDPQPLMAETRTTTVTTTTQTTTFFTLPLWRRKAGLPIALATSEQLGSHDRVQEDGHMARASSVNVDFNKALPSVPNGAAESVSELFGPRRSTGSLQHPTQTLGNTTRPSRASTLMPPSETMKSLAQAGLGIGLPHVMPSAAQQTCQKTTSKASSSSTPRPSTAPRPDRLSSNPVIRRVRSSARLESGSSTDSVPIAATPRRSTIFWPSNSEATNNATQIEPEPKSLIKKASFWNRRRVQSMKDDPRPHNAAEQRQPSPAPALPALPLNSPMFHGSTGQMPPVSSPWLEPTPSSSRPPSLRRRHSEHPTSPRSPPPDSQHTHSPESPPMPREPTRRPQLSRRDDGNRNPVTARRNTLFSNLEYRSGPVSFVTSPAVSSFPVVNGAQRPLSRPRSMTNPPNLLHRLSMGVFSSPTASPLSSPTISTNNSGGGDFSSSPRHSATLGRSSLSKSAVEIPKPNIDGETPESFLGRLEEAVSKAELANILAKSGDPFYSEVLNVYIGRFDFTNKPLDIALRRLLMDVGLPKETQQIDRVMEAFAFCYSKCNPDLFVSEDHPYILSFSLIMLHTDAFNKSNKRKMTKADYIKNTKLVGVPNEVLDYFYDNIVFAPFIFIEDPLDVNGQRGFTQDGQGSLGSSLLGKSNKIDPYLLIARNMLDSLRIDVESHIPLRNPFSYQGTAGSWNEAELRRSFARADIVTVDAADVRKSSSLPFFAMSAGGPPGPIVATTIPGAVEAEGPLTDFSLLKITKVGVLNRKEDLLGGGKRAMSRKWKEWSVILTGSQLIFYRDSSIALNLITTLRDASGEALARYPSPRPDEVVSMKDAVAVCDSSYGKYHHVLRFVLSTGRQLLLQAESEKERNEWIAHINYASAFKTAGIRMRTTFANGQGLNCADSHLPRMSVDEHGSFLDERTTSPQNSPIRGSPRSESVSAGKSRARIVASKIHDFEVKVESAKAQLESEKRIVRNLAVLTPFMKSTRERLQTTIVNMSRHVRQLRLEIVKMTCYRDVLIADLASEIGEQRQSKSKDVKKSMESERSFHSPSTSLAVDTTDISSRSLSPSDALETPYMHRDSSICESFHSALDFGADLLHDSRNSSASQRKSTSVARPSTEITPSSSNLDSQKLSVEGLSSRASLAPSGSDPDHAGISEHSEPEPEQRASDEQAEEWDKTKAARRVSLVRVPGELRVSTRSIRDKRASSIAPIQKEEEEDGAKPSSDEMIE